MATKHQEKKLTLKDNRQLSINISAPLNEKPIFYFHGGPGSRLEQPFTATTRPIITIDRPGYGGSSYLAERSLLDWAKDVQQISEHLEVERYDVIGFSCGAAYAAACAHEQADHIDHLVLINSSCPFSIPGVCEKMRPSNLAYFLQANEYPEELVEALAPMSNDPGALLQLMKAELPEADLAVFNDTDFQVQYEQNLKECLVQDPRALVQDLALVSQEWGFDINNIKTKTHIWHGECDNNLSPDMSQHLHSLIPNSTLHLLPGKGHFFIFKEGNDLLKHLNQAP